MPNKKEYVAYLTYKNLHTNDKNKWFVYGSLAAWINEFCPEDATDEEIRKAAEECGDFLLKAYGNSIYKRYATLCMETLFNVTDMKHVAYVTYQKPQQPLDSYFSVVVGLRKQDLERTAT